VNVGWGKGAGSEQHLPIDCSTMEEGRETAIIHQNRVLQPTTPLGITLDKPWLKAQGTRAGSSSVLLHCSIKELQEEPGLSWKAMQGNL